MDYNHSSPGGEGRLLDWTELVQTENILLKPSKDHPTLNIMGHLVDPPGGQSRSSVTSPVSSVGCIDKVLTTTNHHLNFSNAQMLFVMTFYFLSQH